MKKEKITRKKLTEELNKISQDGISTDTMHLKKDMCAQFSDPDEWIREYVVNAYDAKANLCEIWGEENSKETTIFVKDNGHGMDRQGMHDFFTIYRSRKKGGPRRAIGMFGIGKMSIAAIPCQTKFFVQTSTGAECWEVETGSLLEEKPIRLNKVSQVPEHGTLFAITFKKKEKLINVLKKLHGILRKYTRYLPLDTYVCFPEDKENKKEEYKERIGEEWSADTELFGHSTNFISEGNEFEIILGIGPASHEIYQNRVFISDQYNLLTHDLTNSFNLPNLRIRVDSLDLELPFGRHCLSNEDVLIPLVRHLRKNVFPDYFELLIKNWQAGRLRDSGPKISRIEEMVVELIMFWPHLEASWGNFPVFNIFDHKKVSLAGLEKMVTETGNIYLAETENTGVDYSFFDGPVLTIDQPAYSLNFLKKYFQKELVNLSLNDVVIEAPSTSCPPLTEQDLKFEEGLGIDLEVVKENLDSNFGWDRNTSSESGSIGKSKIDFDDIPREIKDASNDFRKLTWKVNYLVGKDGKTPCKTHRFIVNNDTVILNLYHPDVKKLVKLSLKAPKLAAHWAVAMCLTEDNRILSHLSSERREDLLLLDVMTRVEFREGTGGKKSYDELNRLKRSMWKLLKDHEFDFSKN